MKGRSGGKRKYKGPSVLNSRSLCDSIINQSHAKKQSIEAVMTILVQEA
jgi:hypothetical protein